MTRKPKFRVGQVVSVKSYYGNFSPGQTGPGYSGKRGWRHGWQFGKVVQIMPPHGPYMKKTAPFCYFLDGWCSAQVETDMRPLTTREWCHRPETQMKPGGADRQPPGSP